MYYWETEDNCGRFHANSDDEALQKAPGKCFLYKESDTHDGLPFIEIADNYLHKK